MSFGKILKFVVITSNINIEWVSVALHTECPSYQYMDVYVPEWVEFYNIVFD